MWIRDESKLPQLSSLPATSNSVFYVDDEIEEGEIVESKVNGIVDLLEESFAAVTRSQSFFIDFTAPFQKEPYFEDRGTSGHGKVPQYSTFGNETEHSDAQNSSSDDVICLDSTQPNVDDSVIFVSEVKQPNISGPITPQNPKLLTPDFLKSPVTKKLFNLIPSPTRKTEARKLHDKQRLHAWKKKKAQGFAEKAASMDEPKPSTSAMPIETQHDASAPQLEKRIILIDGSNLAMSYTDNHGSRKTDKDFSAEGKSPKSSIKSLLSKILPSNRFKNRRGSFRKTRISGEGSRARVSMSSRQDLQSKTDDENERHWKVDLHTLEVV